MKLSAIAAALVLASTSAFAVQFEGDLGQGSYASNPAFHLDWGLNEFSDTGHYDNRDPNGLKWLYDFDGLRFVLPGPSQVSIWYDPQAKALPGTEVLTAGYLLIKIPCASFWCDVEQEAEVNLLRSGPQHVFSFTAEQLEWYFAHWSLVMRGLHGGSQAAWSFDLTLNVEPFRKQIPEPPTLLLLGSTAIWGLLCWTLGRKP